MAKRDRVAKRVRDKWKAKSWYTVHAPPMFDTQVLGESPAEDPAQMEGRIAEVTVQDLTGDFSKMHVKVQFRVDRLDGSDAFTRFAGHDMTSDYIRRLTRRKRSRIDGVFQVKTKDDALVRMKPMAITDRRIQSSKQAAIRRIMHRVAYERAGSSSLAEFVEAMILGDLAREIATACKTIQPIFRVEIRRSEVLRPPSVAGEEPIPAAVEESEEELPEEEAPEGELPEEDRVEESSPEEEPPAEPSDEDEAEVEEPPAAS